MDIDGTVMEKALTGPASQNDATFEMIIFDKMPFRRTWSFLDTWEGALQKTLQAESV